VTGPADGEPPDGDDEPLARPFLAGAAGAALPPPGPPATASAPDVRPYLLTGGRTAVDDPSIAMETMVVAAGHPPRHATATARLRPTRPDETAAILALCRHPLSVAEVAAHRGIPLGVARVLVADLVADGLLVTSATGGAALAADIAFLERLIAGVAAL
jgi:Protein of unknown function (DUF742)